MNCKIRIHIRIDDESTNQIYRFENQQSVIVCDVPADKLYRLEINNGDFQTQEVDIIDGVLTPIGDPTLYVKA